MAMTKFKARAVVVFIRRYFLLILATALLAPLGPWILLSCVTGEDVHIWRPSKKEAEELWTIASKYDPDGETSPFKNGYCITKGADFQKWREGYDMQVVSTSIKRFPLPFPLGMGVRYVTSDGRVKTLSDWETRQIAQKISDKGGAYRKFNIYRSFIPDVIGYAALLTISCLANRRRRRVAEREALTRERMERLARLCAEFKERHGRLPQTLEEAGALDASETTDAIFQRPFLYAVVNDEEFFIAPSRSWRSGAFPFHYAKRLFIALKDCQVHDYTGSVLPDALRKEVGSILKKKPSTKLLKPGSFAEMLESCSALCREWRGNFLVRTPLFQIGLVALYFFGYCVPQEDVFFDFFGMGFCASTFQYPILLLWLIALWSATSLWIFRDDGFSREDRLWISALHFASILVVIAASYHWPFLPKYWTTYIPL